LPLAVEVQTKLETDGEPALARPYLAFRVARAAARKTHAHACVIAATPAAALVLDKAAELTLLQR
jgi:hypothetical protein